MATLINKDLVHERGRPLRKYALTDDGWATARRMRAVEKGEAFSTATENESELRSPIPRARSSDSKRANNGFVRSLDSKGDGASSDTRSLLQRHTTPQFVMDPHSAATSSGQRLGGAPTDRFGTFAQRKNDANKEPSSNCVELLSSPEPVEKSSAVSEKNKMVLNAISGNRSPPEPVGSHTNSPSPRAAPSNTAKSNTTTTATVPRFEPIVLPPGSFSVNLVLDNREVRTKVDRDYVSEQLSKLGTPAVVRSLPLGDIHWVAKVHDPALLSRCGEEGDEIALDWIVERKRLDDLVSSITDGRFSEQKFRLRRSGIKNVVYLIEHFTLSQDNMDKYGEAISSAVASTQVVNGYFVKRTEKLDESIRYLSDLTTLLKSIHESKPLYIIPTTALDTSTYRHLLDDLRTKPAHRDRHYGITFASFESMASKSDTLTLRDVYLKMLMCTRGISGDKALAIQKVWPSPRAFVEAFDYCEDDKQQEGMVEKALAAVVGRGTVKGALSAKVADIWAKA